MDGLTCSLGLNKLVASLDLSFLNFKTVCAGQWGAGRRGGWRRETRLLGVQELFSFSNLKIITMIWTLPSHRNTDTQGSQGEVLVNTIAH